MLTAVSLIGLAGIGLPASVFGTGTEPESVPTDGRKEKTSQPGTFVIEQSTESQAFSSTGFCSRKKARGCR